VESCHLSLFYGLLWKSILLWNDRKKKSFHRFTRAATRDTILSMKAWIQRVKKGSVTIEDRKVCEIGQGYVVLLGVRRGDTAEDARYLADRTVNLRIFPDADGKMNLSIQDVAGEIIVVSQFTLHADTRKGNRPSFIDAADPVAAESLYNDFVAALRSELGDDRVGTGVFRADMLVEIQNDGPVSIELKSRSEPD
jgi:D-tyrosyl-tRNA(Tyr) deacylase